jgi:hypothetical protein
MPSPSSPATLSDVRATLDAVGKALEILSNTPTGALSLLDTKYQLHDTMLGRIVAALEKEDARLTARLRLLELAALP